MDKLPDKLLYEILGYLSVEERLVLRSVCRRWRYFGELSCRLVKRLETDSFDLLSSLWGLGFGEELGVLRLQCLDHHFPTLRRLLDLLADKLARHGKLRELRLSHFRWLGGEEGDSEQVDLAFAPPTPFSSVLRVSFDEPRGKRNGLPPQAWRTLLQTRFPNAQLVRLDQESRPRDWLIFTQDSLPQLRHLHLTTGMGMGRLSIDDGSLSQLESLLLQTPEDPASFLPRICEKAPSLRRLWVSGRAGSGPGTLQKLGLLRSLSHLSLHSVPLGPDSLRLLSLGCRELKSLALVKCGVSDGEVSELHRCTGLEVLDLAGNGGIRDFSLIQILPHLRNLRQLWLCSISTLSGLYVPVALSNCPELRSLGIGGSAYSHSFLDYVVEVLKERRSTNRGGRLTVHGHNSSMTLADVFADAQLQGLPLDCDFAHDEAEHLRPPDLFKHT